MDSFGQRLRDLRKNKGLSQERLAEILTVRSGKQTIYNWENGRSEPSLSDLRRIAEVLDTTIGFLVEGIEPEGQAAPAVMQQPPFGYVLLPAQEVVELHREINELKKGKETK